MSLSRTAPLIRPFVSTLGIRPFSSGCTSLNRRGGNGKKQGAPPKVASPKAPVPPKAPAPPKAAPVKEAPAEPTKPPAPAHKTTSISWNEYFDLRSRRRMYDRVFTLPTTLGALGFAGAYVANLQVDPTATIWGMDPLVIYAGGTLGAGFAGFLVGPVVGSTVWRLTHQRIAKSMEQRDKEFYEHIVKNRADASLNSIRNPVPDYYGEKIKSLKDYRSWLRKQREHTRKATFQIGMEE